MKLANTSKQHDNGEHVALQWNLRTKATPGDRPFGLCREVGPCSEVVYNTPYFVF